VGLLRRINKRFGKKTEHKATRLQNPGGLSIPLASTRNVQAKQLQVDFLSITKWAYRGNELVHSCMDERSRALKEAPLKVFDEKNDEWDENNEVELLMRHPNPFRTQADLLETIEQHLSLTGNAFIRKVRDQRGVVRQLWTMHPHLVGIIPDSKTFIGGYTYKVDGIKYPLPVEDVIHLLYIDPADDYFGISPLVAAARRIDADSELGKFSKQLLLNMAVTSGCFVTEKKLNQEERTIMEEKMASRYVGAVRAGLPMVLSHGMKWEQTSMTMKDLEIGNIAAILESRICLALHVPAVVVGAKVGLDKSTFTNVREAREYMYENTIGPEWQMIADKLGDALLEDFGYTDGALVARFDTSKIKALQESEQALWERVRQSKSLSIIEKRLKLGYPAEPHGAIFIDANMVAINPETGEMQPRVAEIEAGVKDAQNLADGGKTEEDDTGPKKKNNEVDTKSLTGIPTAEQHALLLEKLLINEESHKKVMIVAASRMFEEIADEFRAYLDGEGYKSKEIKARITNVRKIRPHIQQIVKRHLQSNITDVVKEGAEGTRSVLGTSFGLTNDEAVSFASKHTSKLAGQIADSSIDTVRGLITEGIKQGRPVNETRKLLESRFADWGSARAETVARTETLRAANMGSLEVLKKGGVEYKQFIVAPDACDTCLALADQVNAVHENYMGVGDSVTLDGGETVKNTYSNMPTPPIHPRCRCTIGGIPASMVQEETAHVKKIGSRSADTGDLLSKFSQIDPAHEFDHMRQPLHHMSLSRAVENGSADVVMRRYGDTMNIFLRDSGTILPTAENWAGQVGHLAYGDTYTWLTTAREAGNLTIRHLANEAGTVVSLTGKSNLGGLTTPFMEFTPSTDIANKVVWKEKLGGLFSKYPEPTKLIRQVGDNPMVDSKTAMAQTGHKGTGRTINFNTKYTNEMLETELKRQHSRGYTVISNVDEVATHEFGHVVDNYLQNMGIETRGEILRTSREHFISDYATRNPAEYFAETFTAYEQSPASERYDIRMMVELLKEGGLIE